jgi:hypothetical protein
MPKDSRTVNINRKGSRQSGAPLLQTYELTVSVSCFGGAALTAHHVAVKERKSDEKGNTDQIFHGLDILVKINQGIDGLDLANGIKKCRHDGILL